MFGRKSCTKIRPTLLTNGDEDKASYLCTSRAKLKRATPVTMVNNVRFGLFICGTFGMRIAKTYFLLCHIPSHKRNLEPLNGFSRASTYCIFWLNCDKKN